MSTLPAEFVVYFRHLVTVYRGNVARAHAALLSDWRRGHVVPGYGTRRDWILCQPEHVRAVANPVPRGWSRANLRRIAPTKIARPHLILVENCAAAFPPSAKQWIEQTFAKLSPRQLVAIDDVQPDFTASAQAVAGL